MELVNIVDEYGNRMHYKRYQGRTFHPDVIGNVGDHLAEVAAYKGQPDDVLLCTFPKSGTHWVFNMVQMIRGNNLEYSGTPVVMEFHPISDIEKLQSPRMYLTHAAYPFIPDAAKRGDIKIIQVMRNPKDSVLSFYEFFKSMRNMAYEGTFDGFLKYFLSDEFVGVGCSLFTYLKEWEEAKRNNKDLQILNLRYEDLKKNLFENVIKISKFLNLERTSSFLHEVEKNVSFERLKKKHDTQTGETDRWKNNTEGGRLPVYRKGIVGDWKNTFTVAQNEKFDAVYKEKMEEMRLPLDEFIFE
ncbi:sulfotransferase 1C2-like isoform X2 [Mizuhopecten yessoensis]|uniref:sulfotransferase 1C2-like isoform X2 n=1 Tax=Mizuhopecten yessoensis TaxID=6573 RepID=UPI000B45A44C|nr:sulfotransferase 1C2-like isoform X2 [Mizuhopecten yessoensis]